MTGKIIDGGPAFPQNDLSAYGMGPIEEGGHMGPMRGLSVRDYAAIRFIAACDGNPNLPGYPASRNDWPQPEELAKRRAEWGFLQADAFLAARVQS